MSILPLLSVVSAESVLLCCGFMTRIGELFSDVSGQRLYTARRPGFLHPFASAIDSPELEEPDELVSILSYSMAVSHKIVQRSSSKPTPNQNMYAFQRERRRYTRIMALIPSRTGIRSTESLYRVK